MKTAPAPLPLEADTDSHGCVFEMLQVSVPPPPLAIAIDCAAGLLPEAVAENASVAGVTESAGGCTAAATVRVTAIVAAEPLMLIVSW
jgi:hypothetical protein